LTFSPNDPTHPSVPSTLNETSWSALSDLLVHPQDDNKIVHTGENDTGLDITEMRDTLQDLMLPGYHKFSVCPWLTLKEKTRRFRRVEKFARLFPLDMLDSSIKLDFRSVVLQPSKLFKLEAYGSQNSADGPQNGASVDLVKRLLRYAGVGNTIDALSMTGTPSDRQSQPSMYTDFFKRPDIGIQLDVTSITFHDVDFELLPTSLGESINFSSVKKVHIIQCSPLDNVLQLFIDCSSGTNLEALFIENYDWTSDYLNLYRFIESFSSLRTLVARICDE
jgi:hypothetical protein